MHHPQKRNVTTSMVELENGHIRKNLTQNSKPQIQLGTQKKKKNSWTVCLYFQKGQGHSWLAGQTNKNYYIDPRVAQRSHLVILIKQITVCVKTTFDQEFVNTGLVSYQNKITVLKNGSANSKLGVVKKKSTEFSKRMTSLENMCILVLLIRSSFFHHLWCYNHHSHHQHHQWHVLRLVVDSTQ